VRHNQNVASVSRGPGLPVEMPLIKRERKEAVSFFTHDLHLHGRTTVIVLTIAQHI